jgi:hypothetical protein
MKPVKTVRVKVAPGWVIHCNGGAMRAGQTVKVDSGMAARYIAEGKANRVRWWE